MFEIKLKALCIWLICCTSLDVRACEKYDNPGVTLAGTLSVETFYGPPNYGESPKTDARERQAILHLAKPLCTIASPDNPAEKDQVRVTVAPMGSLSLRQFVGRMVKVRGSLFHAISGHHHTQVLIAIRKAPDVLPETRSP
jgi:hypothetical protein